MNGRTDFIIPECYVDTNLVETLVGSGGCNHQKGCNQVTKVMQEKFSDRFAVGIIDADKRRPGYLNEFREIASSDHLTLLSHPGRSHFIILVRPAIDGFILSCAKNAGIDMADYELSPVLKKFTQQTKDVMSNSDPRFKRLFKTLAGVEEIHLLKSLLIYFVENRYKASTQVITALFRN